MPVPELMALGLAGKVRGMWGALFPPWFGGEG